MKLHKIRLLLSFAFIILIILGNFVFLLNNFGFHARELKKLDSNQSLGINVINYVNQRSSLDPTFVDSEASHLRDVATLFSTVKTIYYLTLIILVLIIIHLFFSKRIIHDLPPAFIASGLISFLFLIIFFLLSFNFSASFNILHKPFFDENTWIFPSNSQLIQTFPEQYFKDFAVELFKLIFLNCAVFLGIGLFIRKKFKSKSISLNNDSK